MRMYDIIDKKKRGGELSREEIDYFVYGSVKGEIPDYQITALLMAIWFRGMSDEETLNLTLSMANSGETVNLAPLGETVDKHSTGGVGDKTTLIVAPIVAALGGKIAKMSGRGLGHTGGTIDKLESIPGYRTAISQSEFFDIVNTCGLSVIGQSEKIAVADKKFYMLRDVCAEVDSLPLIVSSIMSKKLAGGAKSIVLDVKVGSGAFMKDLKSAEELAEKMVRIGEKSQRRVRAVLTNMDIPLGNAVGNALEVLEAIEVLKGGGPRDLAEICTALAANMLNLSLGMPIPFAEKEISRVLSDGSALKKLREMVALHGGDASYIDCPERFAVASERKDFTAKTSGYIQAMNTEKIGHCSALLGAGRKTKTDSIDYGAGIMLRRKAGDYVEEGEPVATLYSSDSSAFPEALASFGESLTIGEEKPRIAPLIYKTV